MSDRQRQVIEFHKVFDHPTAPRPIIPADNRIRFRLNLITEEFFEILHACLGSRSELDIAKRLIGDAIGSKNLRVDLAELADGLGDLDYVVEGTRLEFGIEGGSIAEEIHRANMAKVECEDCLGKGTHAPAGHPTPAPCGPCKGTGKVLKKRADGKTLKPKQWTPPDIEGVLARQTAEPTWSLANVLGELTAAAEPDVNCVSTPDGGCIGGPCMHDPK
jgi:predicted HAD superfamily Cof-like phosphohydrolase